MSLAALTTVYSYRHPETRRIIDGLLADGFPHDVFLRATEPPGALDSVRRSNGLPREPMGPSWRAGVALRSQFCPERGAEPTGTGREGASPRACRRWWDGGGWSAGGSGQTAARGAPPKSDTLAGVASSQQ